MTMDQIKSAWSMGAAKGNSPAHRNFPDQQAIKTVKSRAVKSFVNTADDSEMVGDSDKSIAFTDQSFKNELESNANTLELNKPINEEDKEIPSNVDIETGEIIEDEETPENIEGQSDFFGDDFQELDKAPF